MLPCCDGTSQESKPAAMRQKRGRPSPKGSGRTEEVHAKTARDLIQANGGGSPVEAVGSALGRLDQNAKLPVCPKGWE